MSKERKYDLEDRLIYFAGNYGMNSDNIYKPENSRGALIMGHFNLDIGY